MLKRQIRSCGRALTPWGEDMRHDEQTQHARTRTMSRYCSRQVWPSPSGLRCSVTRCLFTWIVRHVPASAGPPVTEILPEHDSFMWEVWESSDMFLNQRKLRFRVHRHFYLLYELRIITPTSSSSSYRDSSTSFSSTGGESNSSWLTTAPCSTTATQRFLTFSRPIYLKMIRLFSQMI